ncbi:hypothetical protein [Marinoscillum furvescens]|uniref:Uncharacterized protein n=1 Tax=Marinoscillum furvescens DSM 4134 TaxID=1122208 RepID=A0A3D9L589_MARFU|nr:hypothetical protein [Marinoscillum furvescens]REE00416.1 hypothetical protein C7460_10537 [Marinoscillum furvescens DSM 4134]
MRIALSEIWNFTELIAASEQGWTLELVAGELRVKDVALDTLHALRSDAKYDTELLPSVFTFREILWQPNVFTEASQSLPALRILASHCEELTELYREKGQATLLLYAALLSGIGEATHRAAKALEEEQADVKKALGTLRTATFPIIKFFIHHPQNRLDYHRDALNRLNYAVKVMLTQFYGRYTELRDPFWQVQFTSDVSVEEQIVEKS